VGRFIFECFGKSRDGWISFPALNAQKTEIEVQKNGEKLVATNANAYSCTRKGAPFEQLD
jgi:hypothetical protein